MELPYDPAIPLSGIYIPEGIENRCSNKNLHTDFSLSHAEVVWSVCLDAKTRRGALASTVLGAGGRAGFVVEVRACPGLARPMKCSFSSLMQNSKWGSRYSFHLHQRRQTEWRGFVAVESEEDIKLALKKRQRDYGAQIR